VKLFAITLFFICVFTLPLSAEAQYKCINDKDGTKGATNTDISAALNRANDPLTAAFKAASDPGRHHLVRRENVCTAENSSSLTDFASLATHIQASAAPRTKKIKRSCIEASMQREVGNTGYLCSGGKKEAFENAGKSTPCLSEKVLSYLHFALNQAINCMSTGRDPIDPRFILKKINNETAFNFFIAYNGGVGLGQLTSDPVKEIAGWRQGKREIDGNAKHVLEGVISSSNPACAPFAEVIKKEVNTPPPLPGSPRNYCSWVSPGEGVARNLIYSLGYYVYTRDEIVKPAIARRSSRMAANPEIVNYFTLVAYGPGGPSQAKSLVRSLRLSNSSKPEDVRAGILRNSGYVKQTEEKMLELLAHWKNSAPTPEDKRGDTCVE